MYQRRTGLSTNQESDAGHGAYLPSRLPNLEMSLSGNSQKNSKPAAMPARINSQLSAAFI